ncbi:MAG: outer membrane lipoprotein-sorting protein [Acidobacteriota bacterium]
MKTTSTTEPALSRASLTPELTTLKAAIAAAALAALAALSVPAAATPSFEGLDPVSKGLAIAEEADRRDQGFGDSQATLTMILRNAHGEESTRELRNRTLEQADDGDKSLVIFDHPRDVKGTAFLTFSHIDGDDDQWLYLPALKRVKRISSSNKSGPFMGSEFAYEDISSQEVAEYTYRYLRDEELNGQSTYVVERVPVHPKSGYQRQEVWFDREEFRPLKTVFYDRKGDLLKTLEQQGFERYLERYWRPARMTMVNHQTGKSTELKWSDYVFQNGYSESDFNRAGLARAR